MCNTFKLEAYSEPSHKQALIRDVLVERMANSVFLNSVASYLTWAKVNVHVENLGSEAYSLELRHVLRDSPR